MSSRPASRLSGDLPPLPPVLAFLRSLWNLNHALEVTSSDMLRTIGVTAQQRMVLRIVGHVGRLTAGQLSALLHVHPGTLSATLARLERRGLVKRAREADDARRVVVSLTPAGAALLATSEGLVESAAAAALERAGSESTERTLHTLTLLTATLEEAGARRPEPTASAG
jgi:DNA-binding MarR family transcriptional regulator